ncbi:helix-turn-helix transcriptional regulator [Streptomyces aureus]|uniref:helix-turn-helix transcriptional regulator n=1 Tax=Streptomyces aureus TaxID=193461 RepID=UPI0036C97280
MHDGTIRDHTFQDVRDDFGPGGMVFFAPHHLPYAGRICSARYNITMLDPTLLEQVATGDGTPREPVRLTGHRPHSPAAARHLTRTIVHLRDHVLADPEVAAQPLIASTSSQLPAASVLSAFPSTARTEETAQDRGDAHSATLRRALVHSDDHAAEPLTVAGIAAAAHVTVRALQYAKRRRLGTTPLARLRQVGLAHAHRDLRAAQPGEPTVGEIGARRGFAHPGRFAALYRTAYGCHPSETLRG